MLKVPTMECYPRIKKHPWDKKHCYLNGRNFCGEKVLRGKKNCNISAMLLTKT